MSEKDAKDIEQLQNSAPLNRPGDDEFDAAGKSLADALKISFVILKIIMGLLVIVFLASGFFTVGPEEQALVLRFGKIRGIGAERLLGPGPQWAWPYPIDEIITIPVKKIQMLDIDSFWYYQDELEKLETDASSRRIAPRTLDMRRDGYTLTRNEKAVGITGDDYNIVHSKWRLNYLIDDPELFFRNVNIKDPAPGQRFSDVIQESIAPLLRSVAADVIVTTMVNFSIDEAIVSKGQISTNTKRFLQAKLDQLSSGIKVESMQITQIEWPRQVDDAFLKSTKASQDNQTLIRQAWSYHDKTINEAGGSVTYVNRLLNALEDPNVREQQREELWSQLAGIAQGKITQAQIYRIKVVESAKADARYLQKLLPEYRKRPKLVLQKLYQDAIESILDNVDEKIIIPSSAGVKSREIRILLNRDPAAAPKTEEE